MCVFLLRTQRHYGFISIILSASTPLEKLNAVTATLLWLQQPRGVTVVVSHATRMN